MAGVEQGWRRWAIIALSVGLIAAPALLLLYRTLAHPSGRVDFTPIWLAGRMWGDGLNPYGDQFIAIGRTLSPDPELQPHGWFYPPQWWAICAALGRLPLAVAGQVWGAISLAALALSAMLCWRASDRLANPPPLWLKSVFVAFLLTMEPTNASLFLGQTSLLMTLGIALVAAGMVGMGEALAVAGLVILMLKPQLGAVAAAIMLLQPGMRRAVLIAALVSAVATLPALAIVGVRETLGAWFHQLASYQSFGHNQPAELTGVVQITSRVGLLSVITLPAAVALYAVSLLLVPAPMRSDRRLRWLLLLAAIAAAVPLHAYDLSFVAAAALLAWDAGWAAGATLWLALIVLHRARTIGAVLAVSGDPNLAGARIATVSVLLLLAGTLAAIVHARRQSGGAHARS